jgi:hypothetical protein
MRHLPDPRNTIIGFRFKSEYRSIRLIPEASGVWRRQIFIEPNQNVIQLGSFFRGQISRIKKFVGCDKKPLLLV